MSLRARLLITTIVLVAAGLFVANVATYRFLSNFLIQRVDEQLQNSVFFAADQLSVGQNVGPPHGGPNSLPPGTYAELLNGSGGVELSHLFVLPGQAQQPSPRLFLPAGLPGSTSSPNGTFQLLTARAVGGISSSYRVLAAPVRDTRGTFILAIPLSDVAETLHRLVIVEVIVSAVVLLLVTALALWLVRLGLRPLEGIGETAGAIAAGDLTRRVEPAESRTEVGRLGLALNSMLSQIEKAFEERRASESRLRRFVADASHELRTPLTSIRGYAELFRRGAQSRPEDLSKAMRRIEEEASRMGVLVDDLLLLARLDQGRPLEREPVDLSRIAGEAIDSARTIEPDRPIRLDLAGPAIVVGDEGRLRQVMDNLLDNVRVHTPHGTPVRVRVVTIGDEAILSVSDEGPGLSPEVAGRVFERFYRGDRGTGGAGLGLSIVSAIVEAHGGTAAARSNDGQRGATFEIKLPVSATHESRPQATGIEAAPKPDGPTDPEANRRVDEPETDRAG